MLNSIYIDGYRNLKNLKIDLRPGLNVFIGANGVGKSNIMEASHFFTQLLHYSLNNSPSKIGVRSARSLFFLDGNDRKVSQNGSIEDLYAIFQHEDTIHFRVEGTSVTSCLDISQPRNQSDQDECKSIELKTQYIYDCKIGIELPKLQPLLFLSQDANFQFSVENKPVGEIKLEFNGPNFEIHQDTQYLNSKIDKKITRRMDSLKSLTDTYEFNSILIKLGESFYPIKNILNEIRFAQPLEILPKLIRSERLELSGFGIKLGGTGLFSTLAHLYLDDKGKFDEVVENFKAITSDVNGVEIEMRDQYLIKKMNVNIDRYNGATSRIPIQLLSDGYLKWFSLVVALSLTDDNILIDEPENFMDTIMQSEFPRYLRDELEFKNVSCFLTTHSETLVNSLTPEEINFVDSPNGIARVRRIKEIDRLKKNMNKSGFPLGWYFHTGSLECYCS